MTPARTLVLVGAIALVGCLFPSFDDLKSDTKTTPRPDAGSDGDDDDGDDDDATPPDAGGTKLPDGGDFPARHIDCNDVCPIADALCCTTVGGASCQPLEAETFCPVQGGEVFKCDGDEDCDPGQVCCYAEKRGTCSATCAGQQLCHGSPGSCPPGKTCTGTIAGHFKACQ
ncbi:MAG: hypothetical protein KIT84_29940 [Labilithrix sp.]|nr:hypothetical protein [Labilithrix sp.]MCW5815285.1 hypothetical protein [Labilithrix sp.]